MDASAAVKKANSTEMDIEPVDYAAKLQMNSMKEGLTEILLDDFEASAVISDTTFDPKERLEAIIKRVKNEYTFNMPNYKIDKKFFEKVKNREEDARLLFDSLRNAQVVGDAFENIEMSFYGKAGYRAILLRSCYFDLFELILDSLQIPHDNYWHLILGSPGIGKSWFHVFCLYVLIQADVPVYIQRQGYSTLFFKDEAYRCLVKDLEGNMLRRSNIWHLYDRKEPPLGMPPKNICVVVSSPRVTSYEDYKKLCHFGILFMPLWSFAEVSKANLLRFPKSLILSQATLKERFRICGGIARHIFDDFRIYKKEYKPAVKNISRSDFIIINQKQIDKVTHKVFGLSVSESYLDYEIIFLSKHLADEFVDHMKTNTELTLAALLHEVLDNNSASLAGYIYEREGIRRLASGYQLDLESLSFPNMMVEKFVLPDVVHKYEFAGKSLDKVVWDSKYSTLWDPENSKFPCIDCLLLVPGEEVNIALGFQFTISDAHPVVRKPLAKIIELCESMGYTFRLVFVLSAKKNYEGFGKQRQKDEKGNVCEEEIPCPQHKMKMF